MQLKGFGSHIIKYENKYKNNEANRNHKISLLFINLNLIIEKIISILYKNKEEYINKK